MVLSEVLKGAFPLDLQVHHFFLGQFVLETALHLIPDDFFGEGVLVEEVLHFQIDRVLQLGEESLGLDLLQEVGVEVRHVDFVELLEVSIDASGHERDKEVLSVVQIVAQDGGDYLLFVLLQTNQHNGEKAVVYLLQRLGIIQVLQ